MSKDNRSIKGNNDNNNKTVWRVVSDFLSENGWWFYWVLLSIVIAPFVLYYILIIKSPIGIIKSEYVGDFIAFFGSVISGSFTLVGVIITIKKQNEHQALEFKHREEARIAELRIIYKPFIKYSLKDNELIVFNDKNFFFRILLTNIGRGELYLKSIKIESQNDDLHPHMSFISYFQGGDKKYIILPGETTEILCDNNNLKSEKIDNVTYWNLSYTIEYYDLFSDLVFSTMFNKSYVVNFDSCSISENETYED